MRPEADTESPEKSPEPYLESQGDLVNLGKSTI